MRLQLSVLAYNLGNMWRRLGLSQRIKSWSLTSLQHRLMKTGGRLVKHARYYWLLLAEGHLNRKLFGYMLRRIWALPVAGRLKRLARSGRSWGVAAGQRRSGIVACPSGEPERDRRAAFDARAGVKGGLNATGRQKPLHRSSGLATVPVPG